MPLFIPSSDKFSVVVAQSGALVGNAGSGTGSLDVPGLAITIPRAGTYYFDFNFSGVLDVQPTTVGIGVAFSGTLSALQAEIQSFLNGGGVPVQTVSGTLFSQSITSTSQKPCRVTGRLDATSSGVLKLQVSRSANTLTIPAIGIGTAQEA